MPTGAGQPRIVELGDMIPVWAQWHPAGRRLLLAARGPKGDVSFHLLDLETGRLEPFQGLDGIRDRATFSADGRRLVFARGDGTVCLQGADGGAITALPIRLGPTERIHHWSQDGRTLFVADRIQIPGRIEQLDLETGRRQPWRVLPLDAVEGLNITGLAVSRDGQTWACSYRRVLHSDLYLVQGLK